MNVTLSRFREHLENGLRFELEERAWWEQQIADGRVSWAHAEGYIRAANANIPLKSRLLRFLGA